MYNCRSPSHIPLLAWSTLTLPICFILQIPFLLSKCYYPPGSLNYLVRPLPSLIPSSPFRLYFALLNIPVFLLHPTPSLCLFLLFHLGTARFSPMPFPLSLTYSFPFFLYPVSSYTTSSDLPNSLPVSLAILPSPEFLPTPSHPPILSSLACFPTNVVPYSPSILICCPTHILPSLLSSPANLTTTTPPPSLTSSPPPLSLPNPPPPVVTA